MKRKILITIISIVIIALVGCKQNFETHLTEVEYSGNIESISHYFHELKTIERVYFKSLQKGSSGLVGPSTFSIAGFVFISEDEKNTLIDTYEFVEAMPEFPEGISTDITQLTDFRWATSKEFTRFVLKGNFIGDIFLDTNNGIIYLNVENT